MAEPQQLILTPNQRLARTLQHAHSQKMLSQGHTTWERLEILPIQTWLQTLHQFAAVHCDSMGLPIDPHQAKLLWAEAIGEEIIMGRKGLASLAWQTWQRIHDHELPPPHHWPEGLLNEDQRAFQRWAKRYVNHCQRNQIIDLPSFLPELARLAEHGALPALDTLTLHGFALPPLPAHQRIVDALAQQGVTLIHERPEVLTPQAPIPIHACAHADDELTRALNWAKEHLDSHPNERIGVVIPDLEQRLGTVERTLYAVFHPAKMCRPSEKPPPWHLSLGPVLGQWPLVAEALALLEMQPQKLSQPQAMRLLQNPWLKGWSEESNARQALALQLNASQPYWLHVSTLIRCAQAHCPQLAQSLKHWARQYKRAPTTTHTDGWAEQFQQELSALGFGFGRPLDGIEHQIMDRWHRALETFSGLAAVNVASLDAADRQQAFAELENIVASSRFREQDLGAPISIMGVQEALGCTFDAAWIMGLDEHSWPPTPHRTPLIPALMQANILTSTPQGCVLLAKQQLQALHTMAPIIQGSYAMDHDDSSTQPTRLLNDVICHQIITYNDVLAPVGVALSPLETICDDIQAPPLKDQSITDGGVRLINDQSACPFKAFSIHRLKAKDHRLPRPGVSAKDRGNLAHDALKTFWELTRTSQALAALDNQALVSRVSDAVDAELAKYNAQYPSAWDATTQRLERQNIIDKVVQWLQLEQQRPPFEAIHLEEKITLKIGPLSLAGRPDRVDRLADGQLMIIDYKTGQASKSAWSPGSRLDDAQLPAYALSVTPPAKAIAFAKIGKNQIAFDGLSEHDVEVDGISALESYKQGSYREIDTWPDLMAHWRDELEILATEYQQGHAPVLPARAEVCRHCHLKALCRIAQRSGWPVEELDAEDSIYE